MAWIAPVTGFTRVSSNRGTAALAALTCQVTYRRPPVTVTPGLSKRRRRP
jgi:hypothetical protein